MAEQVHLILRCSVPRLENGQVTQDVVLASCEKGRQPSEPATETHRHTHSLSCSAVH